MGLKKNVYFVSHQKEDRVTEDVYSYVNEFEAFYIERLTHYLLKQGYSTRQITVLTPYSGQRIMIRNQMQKAEYEGIRISNLDQYRGEENDIILLSLVRSNKEGRLGFLDDDNRMCVALSRAKIGLYVIGNFDFIQKHSHKCQIWKEIIKHVEVNESIGKGLPLICRNHKDVLTQVVDPKDFDKVPEGGCSKTCGFRLNCGHLCDLFCHPLGPHHSNITCQKLCAKSCKNGHKCIEPCHFPRACKCRIPTEKKLHCGHRFTQVCHLNSMRNQCQIVVTKKLPCGHNRQMRCFEDPLQFKCTVLVKRRLKCQHLKMVHCFADLESCICQKQVMKTLPCKHQKMLPCNIDKDSYQCFELVFKSLPCKHQKILPCCLTMELYNCEELVTKTLPCQHKAEMLCSQSLHKYKCIKCTQ